MTDHQKLAALIVRFVGAGLAGLMLMSFVVYGFEQLMDLPVKANPAKFFAVDGWYLFIGVLLVATSKRIGKLLATGLG